MKSSSSTQRPKAVIYARVSSKEQEKEGFSIPAQLKLLKTYAVDKGFIVCAEYIDVETAKAAGRSQFNEMLKYLQKNGDIKKILVEKTDRLYRNFKDYVSLESLDLEIHLIKEGSILSKDSRSHEKFIHGIKVLMAKNYIDNLAEETKKGMREKAEQGGYPGMAPVGYKNNTELHTIEVDEEKAPFIRKLFEWYASGTYSLWELRKKCMDARFCARKTEKRISRSNIEFILKNIFYTGYFSWDSKIYKGTYPSIISQELFGAVQEAFEKHNKPRGRRRKRFAFMGLLYCGRCGCSITAQIQKEKYIYYHCTNAKGTCKGPFIREETLANRLGEAVKAIKISADKVEWIKEALKMSHKDEKEYHDKAINTLQNRYTRLQNRIDQAYLDKLDGQISEEFWMNKAKEWRKEQERIRADIQAHESSNRNYLEEGIQILKLANKAYSLYLHQTAHEKARLLRVILYNCTLNNGTPCFTYRKPFDILAQGVKTGDWLPG